MKNAAAALTIALAAHLVAGGCSSGGSSLDDGLVARYAFDGNARDSSPAHVHGQVRGATFVADRNRHARAAAAFDGEGAQILAAREHYAVGDQLSVSLWVKTDAFDRLNEFVTCSDFGVYSRYETVGLAIFASGMETAGGPIMRGSWNHFVGTYDGQMIRAYVNGALVQSKRFSSGIADRGRTLTFGGEHPRFWPGALDEVRIYDRVLTDEEVRRLFEG